MSIDSDKSKKNGVLYLTDKKLKYDVKIIRDKFGVPHIYADTINDAYFGFGYTVAQDRLWQLELYRRVISGRLSELFGETLIEQDKFFRSLSFEQLARKQAKQFGENADKETKDAVIAYYSGINAFISNNSNIGPEFEMINYRPLPFTLEDGFMIISLLSMELSTNYHLEMLRFDLKGKLGKLFNNVMSKDHLHGSDYNMDIGISNSFDNIDIFTSIGQGSNNWAVSPDKSETGSTLLANDPHVGISIPGFFHVSHIVGPDINVIGGTPPGIPVIVSGHNNKIAWGLTNSFADVQDLFIIKQNPDNDKQYLYKDKWLDYEIRKEIINVRGKDPIEISVLNTVHGPIMEKSGTGFRPEILDKNNNIKLAFRYAIYDDHPSIFETTLSICRANNWDEFKKSLERISFPSQNFIFADEKNIGYHMCGKVPIRKNGKGREPVPGWNDDYEWNGYIPFEELPHSYNPPKNFVATANSKVVSENYPHFITEDWIPPYRIQRITEKLIFKNKLSQKYFREMQNDVKSTEVREFLPFLLNIKTKNELENQILQILSDWDHSFEKSSIAASIYEIWKMKLNELIFKPLLGDEVLENFNFWLNPLPLLKYPTEFWFNNNKENNIENRDHTILIAFQKVILYLKERAGDMDDWRWGNIHQIMFTHSLSQVNPLFNRGPFEINGHSHTINAAFYIGFDDYNIAVGPTYRQIIDLRDFSNSEFINIPGQSGDPSDSHYSDNIEKWINGEYNPLLVDFDLIQKNKESDLTLKSD